MLDELSALIARHARPDGRTPLDGVLLSRVDRPGPPETTTSGTVFALIARGGKRLVLGDRVFDYRAGQYLVASVDLPVSGHFTGPSLGFGLELRPSVIASLLDEADPPGGRAPSPGGPAPSGIAVSDASGDLVDAVVRMVRLIERPRDRAILAPMIEREILWRLITGDQAATVREMGLAGSSLTRISKAVAWIRAHYASSFRVEDLARECGMSVSAFHRGFQAVTAVSPIQFQKRIRLQEARLRLASSRDVAGAGFAVGYESASQFSRDYRRQFGVPPSLDRVR